MGIAPPLHRSRDHVAERHHPAATRILATERLRRSPYPSVRQITCELHEGVATLRGRVYSFYLKQIAQETVRLVAGVEVILNRIEVIDAVV